MEKEPPAIVPPAVKRRGFPISRSNLVTALAGCLVIAVAATLYYRATRPAGVRNIRSVAVLPLKNLTGGPADEYLVDGLTEGLISEVSKIPNLKVICRGSVFAFKDKEIDPQAVGKRLGVVSLLEGSVRKNKDSTHVDIRLVSADDSRVLWTLSADRPLNDFVAIEDELARGISAALRPALKMPAAQRVAKTHTPNSEAYQCYLKGRFLWNKRTAEDIRKSIDYFNQAIEADPGYPLAYAGLADAFALLNYYDGSRPSESFPKSARAAEKALQIDDTLAEAHASLAYTKRAYEWDWAGAEREFRRAIELNPNYATAHFWYGEHLVYLGRFEEGIAEIKRAEELDPLSMIISGSLGWAFHMARQPDRAIAQVRKTLDLDPNFSMTHFYLGMAYEGKEMYREAIAAYQKAAELSPKGPGIVGLGHAYAKLGMKDEAQAVLTELKQRVENNQARPSAPAIVCAGLDDADCAFEWMERAYAEHAEGVVYLKAQPFFDGLRSDPRRIAFLRRIGLD